MDKIKYEEKIKDYNELISLLNKKLTIISSLQFNSDPVKEIENKIDIHKLKVDIREKTAYRDKLIPLLKQEEDRFNAELNYVNQNFEALLADTKKMEGDMDKKHKAMFRTIKNHYKDNSWESEAHKMQGFRTVSGMNQHYGATVS